MRALMIAMQISEGVSPKRAMVTAGWEEVFELRASCWQAVQKWVLKHGVN
jgi:hypothetical protein